jgi:hypothetical protein
VVRVEPLWNISCRFAYWALTTTVDSWPVEAKTASEARALKSGLPLSSAGGFLQDEESLKQVLLPSEVSRCRSFWSYSSSDFCIVTSLHTTNRQFECLLCIVLLYRQEFKCELDLRFCVIQAQLGDLMFHRHAVADPDSHLRCS